MEAPAVLAQAARAGAAGPQAVRAALPPERAGWGEPVRAQSVRRRSVPAFFSEVACVRVKMRRTA